MERDALQRENEELKQRLAAVGSIDVNRELELTVPAPPAAPVQPVPPAVPARQR